MRGASLSEESGDFMNLSSSSGLFLKPLHQATEFQIPRIKYRITTRLLISSDTKLVFFLLCIQPQAGHSNYPHNLR